MDATAPRRIQTLPSELANQIAAGEVVERPASVVKELVENSLDAGATRIEVDVERGGVALVRVRDNGGGIHPDDLALALSSHATSKISTPGDLVRLVSLGFRGEALASIASVARVAVTSRPADAEAAWRIDGSESVAPAAHPQGTSVEVRDLFYNTPARRKFLRSESTEFAHIEQLFRRLALSRPDLGFSLSHNGRSVLRVRAADDLERRVSDIAGRAFVRAAAPVEFAAAGLRVHGWIAGPEGARSQADLQYCYVNGRLVRDRLIGHAVRQGHCDRIPEGRHPAYVLYLELDAAEVDVNVHPTKHEVRFREARLVHDFLYRAVSDALAPALMVPQRPEAAVTASPYPKTALRAAPQPAVSETMAAYAGLAADATPAAPRTQHPPQRLGRLAALLFGRFVLTQAEDGHRLIDAGCAREALALHRLTSTWRSGGIRSQPLLVPERLPVSPEAVAVLEAGAERLADLGFEISPLGSGEVVVRQLPAPLRETEPKALVEVLLGSWNEGDDELLLRRLAACARTAPRRAPDRAEAERLVAELEPLAEAIHPCWVRLTAERLESLFG